MIKKILSAEDLAINGSFPAFSEPLHVGSPMVGDKKLFYRYLDTIFETKRLTNNGPMVQELETEIAKLHNVKHCVAMCNGTIALEIAIRALELSGEVIVPSYTFIATAHALSWQAISPVFADIERDTHNIDPEDVKKKITSETTGIIAVHLWGRAAPIEPLQLIAEEYGLGLIFDASHAFGCNYNGIPVGSFGDCEVFSFHATKLFNTFEGGAVLTNNEQLAEKMRLMRNFGFSGLDKVVHTGTNGKMTEVCAAMGLTNLESLSENIAVNKRNFSEYCSRVNRIPGLQIVPFNGSNSVNYQYVVIEVHEECILTRDELMQTLNAENILARRYFWPGCHKMQPYRDLQPDASKSLAMTENISRKVLVLPTGSHVDPQKIMQICDIMEFCCRVNL